MAPPRLKSEAKMRPLSRKSRQSGGFDWIAAAVSGQWGQSFDADIRQKKR